MAITGKPSSSERDDISETSTLSGTQDIVPNDSNLPMLDTKICGAPTNYLRVLKNGPFHKVPDQPIGGQYLIDLSLPPVPQTVGRIASGPENVFFLTKNGAISTEVWVTGNNKLRQASMHFESDSGHIAVVVHDAFSGGGREQRPCLDIDIKAGNGNVSVSLPRCFHGLVEIKDFQGRVVFSPTLKERTALLSVFYSVHTYLVGDRPRSWMLWGDVDDKKRGKSAPCSGVYPEEAKDKLSVITSSPVVQIFCGSELELSE